MKTITIPVQVPDWVTCYAQGPDGDWWIYEHKPTEREVDWEPINKSRFYPLGIEGEPNPNWRETLRKV